MCGPPTRICRHFSYKIWFISYSLMLAPGGCSILLVCSLQCKITLPQIYEGYNRAQNGADLPPQCSMSNSKDVHKGPNHSSCPKWIVQRRGPLSTTLNIHTMQRCIVITEWCQQLLQDAIKLALYPGHMPCDTESDLHWGWLGLTC